LPFGTYKKIAVECQRLVYGGKEIADGKNLLELGIDDGSTIFLVERVENVNAAPVSSPVVVAPPVAEVISVPEESVSRSVPVEPMSVSSRRYVPLSNTANREERIQSTIDLAFWVRVYCIFGFAVSLLSMAMWLGAFLPLVFYLFGYIACRKLNRCLLVFPLLVSIVVGPIGFVCVLWNLATHFWPPLFAALVVSFLHILIMASILKLGSRIKHLSCEEKQEAVGRIRARIRCCCC